jgi:hypothetical protein
MTDVPDYLQQDWPSTRQIDRRNLTVPVTLATSDQRTYRGWCNDVSTGGLGATIAVPLKLGYEVSLEFPFPDSPELIRVRAIVRYTNGFRHGFEFLDLNPTQLALISAYQHAPVKKSPVIRRR